MFSLSLTIVTWGLEAAEGLAEDAETVEPSFVFFFPNQFISCNVFL